MSPAIFVFSDYYSFQQVYDAAGFTMARDRTKIVKMLLVAVICLLVCAIVAGEFPELLSLTDNATNDFTVVRTKSLALHVLVHASRRRPVAENDRSSIATALLFSHLSPFQEVASAPSKPPAPYSVLRT
jgi:hypothetical protein